MSNEKYKITKQNNKILFNMFYIFPLQPLMVVFKFTTHQGCGATLGT